MNRKMKMINQTQNQLVTITKANLSRIKPKRKDFNSITEKYFRGIDYLLNTYQIRDIDLYAVVIENFDELAESNLLKIVTPTDPMSHINPPSKPKYHFYEDCEFLGRDYENWKIPVEITTLSKLKKNAGDLSGAEKIISDWREFWKENIKTYEHKRDYFAFIAGIKFGVQIENLHDLSHIKELNSGFTFYENSGLKNVELNIQLLIDEMTSMKRNSKEIQDFGYRIHKAYKFINEKKVFLIDIPGSDIAKWQIHCRNLINLLKLFFQVKFNNDVTFNGQILDQLGFEPCSKCAHKNNSKNYN